jgi:hypothetical protein
MPRAKKQPAQVDPPAPVLVAEPAHNLRDRLLALFEALLQDSRIGAAFRPVILNMGRSFLTQASDAELREGIEKVRDEMIPFLLGEDEPIIRPVGYVSSWEKPQVEREAFHGDENKNPQ